MSRIGTTAQNAVRIEVQYYNDDEMQKLLDYPSAASISSVVSSGVNIPTAQFLTYYLFYLKRPGKPGYRRYNEIAKKLDRALNDLDEWVHLTGGTVVSAQDAVPADPAMTERIGVAIALSVIGQIHGLHEADWERIPERPGPYGVPTFDYKETVDQGSDGQHVVHVEAKGSVVQNTDELSGSIRTHRASIAQKKIKIEELERNGQYPFPAEIRYGAIGAIGRNGSARCWLIDPPGDDRRDAPRTKLLSRLQFIQDWISFLSGRSQFAASLATRIASLRRLDDPFSLNRVPLFRGDGRPYETFGLVPVSPGLTFFPNLCRVVDGPARGTVLRLSNNKLFFLGLQGHLFAMAMDQDFERITTYAEQGGSVEKRLLCVVPSGRANAMNLRSIVEMYHESGGYVHFNAIGEINYGQGGTVFGVVSPTAQKY